MVKTGRALELEPLERLEQKITRLVGLLERLRAEHQAALDENARLKVEIEGLQSRLADAEHASAEIVALREERDQIRARVESLLGQLDDLGLGG
jgi:regulator of replication initiation timing